MICDNLEDPSYAKAYKLRLNEAKLRQDLGTFANYTNMTFSSDSGSIKA